MRENASATRRRTPGAGLTTVADVAREAGVATSTVSRWLRGELKVQPSTELRIRDAVERLNYVPHAGARGLAVGRTNVVGLVVPELTNRFFAALADAVILHAARHELSVLACSTHHDRAQEARYSDLLAAGAVDGLVYAGLYRENERLAAAARAGLPISIVDEPLTAIPEVDTTVVDNFAGAFQATSHLLSLGHTKIAYLGGPPEQPTAVERERGYIAALQRSGAEPDPVRMFRGSYSEEFGINVLPHLLSTPDPPTAIFAGSDLIALGVLGAAEQHGLDVPRDLSLVGFDDMAFNDNLRPRLTSVHQPVEAIARSAIDRLVARIDDPTIAATTVVLPVTLVIRDSSQPPGHDPSDN
jgi:DNA-binding LacI/PurR family transcriptional regulator